jgi:uncharacterized membrane protein YebE (DUF533 family)
MADPQMPAHRLGRDVFLALAAIGWSDGKLDPDEADAICRTALESGLEIEEIAEIEKATKARVDLAILDHAKLSQADRLYVYAVASWLVRLDGAVDGGELDTLRRLGDMLKLPDRAREHADVIALEIADLPEGDRPARYDLPALRVKISERLAHAQREREIDGQQRLGRDVFMALAAVGWADGKLDADEADAIVRTAVEEGLDLEEIEEIEKATKAPLEISFIDHSRMTKADRLFVYAVASWMTRLDGVLDAGEVEALRKLGEALRVPEKPREHADAIAREIAESGEDDADRPVRFDLPRLRDTIVERLAEAQRLRAEAEHAGGEREEQEDRKTGRSEQ